FGPSELLPRRLELAGIDPEAVRHTEPTTLRDLARVCASCQASRRCARDLARGDAQAGMDAYCLNSATIDALTASCNGRGSRSAREVAHVVVDDAPGRAAGDAHA